jgi:hypothetical protein
MQVNWPVFERALLQEVGELCESGVKCLLSSHLLIFLTSSLLPFFFPNRAIRNPQFFFSAFRNPKSAILFCLSVFFTIFPPGFAWKSSESRKAENTVKFFDTSKNASKNHKDKRFQDFSKKAVSKFWQVLPD